MRILFENVIVEGTVDELLMFLGMGNEVVCKEDIEEDDRENITFIMTYNEVCSSWVPNAYVNQKILSNSIQLFQDLLDSGVNDYFLIEDVCKALGIPNCYINDKFDGPYGWETGDVIDIGLNDRKNREFMRGESTYAVLTFNCRRIDI